MAIDDLDYFDYSQFGKKLKYGHQKLDGLMQIVKLLREFAGANLNLLIRFDEKN